METLIVSKNGEVTLPANLCRQLALVGGSQLRLSYDQERNTLSLTPIVSIREGYGILPKPEKALSIEEMTEAMEKAVASECSRKE